MAQVQSFTEALKLFESYKQARGDRSPITKTQLSKLREAFKAGKIEVKSSANDGFAKVLKEYSAFKKQKTGNGIVSLKERKNLFAGMKKLNETAAPRTRDQIVQYQKLLKEFSQYKLETRGTAQVTASERSKLREAALKQQSSDNSVALTEYRKLLKEFSDYKFKKQGDRTVTLSERTELRKAVSHLVESKPATQEQITAVKQKLHEARFSVFKGNRALKEGDIPAAGDAAGGAMDAMAGAADAAGGAQLPPDVTQKIQALQTAVNDLATAAGIQPPVDMGADPSAGVPADTSAGVDPNAAPPMQERSPFDLAAAKRRIKEREAKLAEHVGAQKIAAQTADDIKSLGTAIDMSGSKLSGARRIATSNPPSQGQGQGSTAEAINGSKSAAKTWPTKPGPKELAKGGATSQSTNINESTALDEQHVDKILNEEKLDFKSLFGIGSILG